MSEFRQALKALASCLEVKRGESSMGNASVRYTSCPVCGPMNLYEHVDDVPTNHKPGCALVAAKALLARPEPDTSCTIGLGDGSGNLFVHGSYEAIKIVQALVLARPETDKAELHKKLRQLCNLSETYWSQADSESYAQNKRSDETHKKRVALMAEIAAMFEPAAAEKAREWIPIGERLPTHIYSVLGWIVAPRELVFADPFAHPVVWNANRGKWQCVGFDDDDIDVEVTHWMPLPSPPAATGE